MQRRLALPEWNSRADGDNNRWKKRQWRSVQSIMGATEIFPNEFTFAMMTNCIVPQPDTWSDPAPGLDTDSLVRMSHTIRRLNARMAMKDYRQGKILLAWVVFTLKSNF